MLGMRESGVGVGFSVRVGVGVGISGEVGSDRKGQEVFGTECSVIGFLDPFGSSILKVNNCLVSPQILLESGIFCILLLFEDISDCIRQHLLKIIHVAFGRPSPKGLSESRFCEYFNSLPLILHLLQQLK